MTTPRNTTTRDEHRRIIARDEPPCGICGQPIDYRLNHRHPRSFVVDHITPRARGGPDTLDNKQAAHRDCNRAKSDKTVMPTTGVTFVTERNWWTKRTCTRR
ncbi:hypothetical protein MINS_12340 [Mycolicibacterium insubricum]|uniref:HNH endonuclease n=1 Tax=Mycolicibacterium insubricum TaxID=444597 RepID=A0A1X0CRP0_9MYCO|nr:HNH endonuclease signature motif containing protein [Mycolicibacterium insubricum]MCV7083279.1 HNH endonuclease [Mycolicibacterium insubricum]ORA62824.1 HNH endonuclease [Mycolicibacterium insubricum]BBZ65805.1 hypothetical protein MINS_12340 [Mycolicibacterium insubricum]